MRARRGAVATIRELERDAAATVQRDERGRWLTSGNPAGGTPMLDLHDAATRERIIDAMRATETVAEWCAVLGVSRRLLYYVLGEDEEIYALHQRVLRGRRAVEARAAQELASRARARVERDIESGGGKDVQAVTVAYGILADQAARQGGLADASQRLQVRLAIADHVVAAEVRSGGGGSG